MDMQSFKKTHFFLPLCFRIPSPPSNSHRTLSSSTYLHRVHVNAAMSSNLLPDYAIGMRVDGSSPRDVEEIRKSSIAATAAATATTATKGSYSNSLMPTCYKPNTVIFRRRVRMLDEREREWVITYESLCSAGQRHTRFSAGWAAMCKANEFRVGDTIVFSRWGDRETGIVVISREEVV